MRCGMQVSLLPLLCTLLRLTAAVADIEQDSSQSSSDAQTAADGKTGPGTCPSNIDRVESPMVTNSFLQNAIAARRKAKTLESDDETDYFHMTQGVAEAASAAVGAAAAPAAAAQIQQHSASHVIETVATLARRRGSPSPGRSITENSGPENAKTMLKSLLQAHSSLYGCLAGLARPKQVSVVHLLFTPRLFFLCSALLLLSCWSLFNLVHQKQLWHDRQLQQQLWRLQLQQQSLAATSRLQPVTAALPRLPTMVETAASQYSSDDHAMLLTECRLPRPSLGAVLMPHLVVPAGRTCTLLLPHLPQVGARLHGQCHISTSDGVPVIAATFGAGHDDCRKSRHQESAVQSSHRRHQCLALQSVKGSSVFALCHNAQPRPDWWEIFKGSAKQQIEIMSGSTGRPFGIVSWTNTEQNTCSVSSTTMPDWEFHFPEPFHGSTVKAVDRSGLVLATLETTPGATADTWHRKVTVAPLVDAGLVVAAALSAEMLMRNAASTET